MRAKKTVNATVVVYIKDTTNLLEVEPHTDGYSKNES